MLRVIVRKNVAGVHRRNLEESGYRSILIKYHVCNHRPEDIGSKVEERAWYVSQPQGRPLCINLLCYIRRYLEEIASTLLIPNFTV